MNDRHVLTYTCIEQVHYTYKVYVYNLFFSYGVICSPQTLLCGHIPDNRSACGESPCIQQLLGTAADSELVLCSKHMHAILDWRQQRSSALVKRQQQRSTIPLLSLYSHVLHLFFNAQPSNYKLNVYTFV